MGVLSNLLVRIAADASQFQQTMRQVSRDMRTMGDNLQTIGSRFSMAISAPLIGVGAAALKVAGDLEQAKVGFTTMLGSAEKAGAYLHELSDFAKKTPFELPGLIQNARSMMGMGFAAKEVLPSLTAIGNAVAAMGGRADTLDRVVLQLSQMRQKGKVMADEMNRIAEAGIDAWKYLEQGFGKGRETLMNLSRQGALDGRAAAKFILEGMQRDFAGAMDAQSRTLNGLLSNLKDEITLTLNDIGQAMLPFAKAVAEGMIAALGSVKSLALAFGELPGPIQSVALALGGLAAAIPLTALGVGMTISAVGSLAQAFGRLAPAVAAASTALSGLSLATVRQSITEIGAALTGNLIGPLTKAQASFVALGRFGGVALTGITLALNAIEFAKLIKGVGEVLTDLGLLKKGVEDLGAASTKTESTVSKLWRSFKEGVQDSVVPMGKTRRDMEYLYELAYNLKTDKTRTQDKDLSETRKKLNESLKSPADLLAKMREDQSKLTDTPVGNAFVELNIKSTRELQTELTKAKYNLETLQAAFNRQSGSDSITTVGQAYTEATRSSTVSLHDLAAATFRVNEIQDQLRSNFQKTVNVFKGVKGQMIPFSDPVALGAMHEAEAGLTKFRQAALDTWRATQKLNAEYGQFGMEMMQLNFGSEAASLSLTTLGQAFLNSSKEGQFAADTLRVLDEAARDLPDPLSELEAQINKNVRGSAELKMEHRELTEVFYESGKAFRQANDLLQEFGVKVDNVSIDDLNAKMKQAAELAYEGTISWQEYVRILDKIAQANLRAGKSFDSLTPAQKAAMSTVDAWDKAGSAAERSAKTQETAAKKIAREVSTVFTDLSRSIADAIVDWKGLGSAIEQVLKSIAKAIIRILIQEALGKLGDKLKDLHGWLGKLGKVLSDTFGKGAASAAGSIGGAAGSAGSAAGSIGGAAGQVGSAAGSAGSAVGSAVGGAMGVVNMISGAVTAVSSVIGNFQMSHMNTNLGRIEQSTRGALNQLISIQETLNTYLPNLKDIIPVLFDIKIDITNKLYDKLTRIDEALRGGASVSAGLAGAGSVTIQVYGYVTDQQMDDIVRKLKARGIIP